MANDRNWGGYRAPANPAPISGPGAHSRRTDGNFQSISTVPDQPYGDAGQQAAAQRIAPLAGQAPMPPAAPVQSAPQPGQQDPYTHPTPYNGPAFGAPTQRPNEPVTTGVPIGPGAGPIAVPPVNQQPTGAMTSLLQSVAPTDSTGILAQLYQLAAAKGV